MLLELPEPPKPKPPTEERPSTAMPSVAIPSVPAPPTLGPLAVYIKRGKAALAAHIERFQRYPAEARARDEYGVGARRLHCRPPGLVRASHIVQSSGSPTLDLAMLNRAQPVPPPPAQLPGSELSFVVPVRFNMK